MAYSFPHFSSLSCNALQMLNTCFCHGVTNNLATFPSANIPYSSPPKATSLFFPFMMGYTSIKCWTILFSLYSTSKVVASLLRSAGGYLSKIFCLLFLVVLAMSVSNRYCLSQSVMLISIFPDCPTFLSCVGLPTYTPSSNLFFGSWIGQSCQG